MASVRRDDGRPRLSLCMIAKDEELFLEQCLRSAKPVVDEIIIVDTGSTDRTIEIAKQFEAKVIEFPWSDDFSAARNVGLDQAAGEWILHLDADEELVKEDLPRLKGLLSNEDYLAFLLIVVNLRGKNRADSFEQTLPGLRLFRNLPDHRFTGVLHERVTIRDEKNCIGLSDVRVRHYGYLEDIGIERKKRQRNLRLLEKSHQQETDGDYQRFIEANEYMSNGRFSEALDIYLALYNTLSGTDHSGLSTIILNIAYCLVLLKRPGDALPWIETGLNLFPDYTDLQYLRGRLDFDAGNYHEALTSFAACLAAGDAPAAFYRREGVGSWLAWQGIGRVFIKIGHNIGASAAFRKALAVNARDEASLKELGLLLLACGHSRQAVENELAQLVDPNSPATKNIFAILSRQGPR